MFPRKYFPLVPKFHLVTRGKRFNMSGPVLALLQAADLPRLITFLKLPPQAKAEEAYRGDRCGEDDDPNPVDLACNAGSAVGSRRVANGNLLSRNPIRRHVAGIGSPCTVRFGKRVIDDDFRSPTDAEPTANRCFVRLGYVRRRFAATQQICQFRIHEKAGDDKEKTRNEQPFGTSQFIAIVRRILTKNGQRQTDAAQLSDRPVFPLVPRFGWACKIRGIPFRALPSSIVVSDYSIPKIVIPSAYATQSLLPHRNRPTTLHDLHSNIIFPSCPSST